MMQGLFLAKKLVKISKYKDNIFQNKVDPK